MIFEFVFAKTGICFHSESGGKEKKIVSGRTLAIERYTCPPKPFVSIYVNQLMIIGRWPRLRLERFCLHR